MLLAKRSFAAKHSNDALEVAIAKEAGRLAGDAVKDDIKKYDVDLLCAYSPLTFAERCLSRFKSYIHILAIHRQLTIMNTPKQGEQSASRFL